MQLFVATSISMWYFTRDKIRVGNSTVFQAVCLASFYHLGTAAFGSLIVGKIIKHVTALCLLCVCLFVDVVNSF